MDPTPLGFHHRARTRARALVAVPGGEASAGQATKAFRAALDPAAGTGGMSRKALAGAYRVGTRSWALRGGEVSSRRPRRGAGVSVRGRAVRGGKPAL